MLVAVAASFLLAAGGARRRLRAGRTVRRAAAHAVGARRAASSAGSSPSRPSSTAQLSGLIRAAKTDGSAVWTLLGLSFVYGIFHAAGPGHGKAVISSYLVANDETWRRGVVLSFASAMLQALVAVALVGIAAVLIERHRRRTMRSTVRWIEIVSYALIALVGLRLIWVKGTGFLRACAKLEPAAAAVGAAVHAGA